MPIEINELIIRTTIVDGGASENAESSSGGNGGSNGNMENMIQECVNRVMEILNDKKER